MSKIVRFFATIMTAILMPCFSGPVHAQNLNMQQLDAAAEWSQEFNGTSAEIMTEITEVIALFEGIGEDDTDLSDGEVLAKLEEGEQRLNVLIDAAEKRYRALPPHPLTGTPMGDSLNSYLAFQIRALPELQAGLKRLFDAIRRAAEGDTTALETIDQDVMKMTAKLLVQESQASRSMATAFEAENPLHHFMLAASESLMLDSESILLELGLEEPGDPPHSGASIARMTEQLDAFDEHLRAAKRTLRELEVGIEREALVNAQTRQLLPVLKLITDTVMIDIKNYEESAKLGRAVLDYLLENPGSTVDEDPHLVEIVGAYDKQSMEAALEFAKHQTERAEAFLNR